MKRDEANEDAQGESERKESKECSRVADAVVRCDQIASAADTRQNGERERQSGDRRWNRIRVRKDKCTVYRVTVYSNRAWLLHESAR